VNARVGQHWAPRARGWAQHRLPLVAGSGVAIVVLVGGAIGFVATQGTGSTKRNHAAAAAQARESAAVRSTQAQLLAALRINPPAGATNVPLNTLVTISDTAGSITTVKVTSAAGTAMAGATSPTTGQWASTGSLVGSTTYSVDVSVTSNGVTATRTSSFSTLTPTDTVTASVFPTDGMQVGVGQPIVLRFNYDVTSPAAQKAIESRLTVAMTTPVAGGWYWFSNHELHFRPHTFWAAHEIVQISGDLGGIDAKGTGVAWTAGSVLDSFSVGDARISYANLASEVMTVTLNGATLYSYPISGGRPQYPTMNGVHVVLDRETVVHMVSSTVGIPVHSPNGYDEYVYDDVHISDSGEYVHAAPWSVGSQGRTNVSHGCINLSTYHAMQFYNFSRIGDVVEVTGSPRPAAYGDHGVMDWSNPPWSAFAPAHVVQLASSSVAPTTSSTVTTIVRNPVVPTTASAPVRTVPATATTAAATTTVPKTTTTTKSPTTTAPKTTSTTKPIPVT
jgi:lipoprotein-anchoring transpeptidase ErfK/SrfK